MKPADPSTYHQHADETRLDLFKGHAIFHAYDLLLHWDSTLKSVKNNIGKLSNRRQTVVGAVSDEGVEDFVCRSPNRTIASGTDAYQLYSRSATLSPLTYLSVTCNKCDMLFLK